MPNKTQNRIIVNGKSSLDEVQSGFNKLFPYLKVSFCSKFVGQSNEEKIKLVENLKKDFNSFQKGSSSSDTLEFEITPNLSVSDLDKKFFDNFGLNVQIHRNSGRLWLNINATNSWTLEEQNKQGRDLCA